MKCIKFVFAVGLIFASTQTSLTQNTNPPPPVAQPTPKFSETLTKTLSQTIDRDSISAERREQAFVKLFEAERHLWRMRNRQRTQAMMSADIRLARQALQKAIELDPTLSEAYTALAELTSFVPPYDVEEAILLASIAAKLNKDSFGAHRLLARLYTIKSRGNNGNLDANFTQKAIGEWKEVTRLDPRNAEAFAFLSDFYAKTKNNTERLDALRKWVSSTAPLDTKFYTAVMGEQSNLSSEGAAVKYGQALLESGESREAVEVLSRTVADNPGNEEAVESLQLAVESVEGAPANVVLQALQQAVFANAENATLISILARAQVKSGKIDDAAKTIRDSTAKIAGTNKNSAAAMQVLLGDIFFEAARYDDAVNAFQNALKIRGIGDTSVLAGEDRDFAIRTFDKLINTYKKANRPEEVKNIIERARVVLGKANSFADLRLVSFYLDQNKRTEALQAVRALRTKTPTDGELLKLEARILTEQGKVDEAVALFKSNSNQINNGGRGNGDGTFTISDAVSPEIGNYLYISELYTLAKRPKQAVETVNQALTAAKSPYEKEIVRLTLATTQQQAGDYKGAETTLRNILKESPQNPFALNNLGYFLAERGESLDEAVNLIEKALAVDPGNPSYLDSLGWAYFKLGKLSEAEKSLKAALRLDDSSATIQEHLGDVYAKQGKTELARGAWQKSLELTSDTSDINRLKSKLNAVNLK